MKPPLSAAKAQARNASSHRPAAGTRTGTSDGGGGGGGGGGGTGSSWCRFSVVHWTVACGLASLVIMVAVSSEESWAYLDARATSAGLPPEAGAPPSLLQVETAQVRRYGGGCGGGGDDSSGAGFKGGGVGASSCPWAYRRADDVEAAPRKAACHKKKRTFTDRPRAAGVLAVSLDIYGGGGGGESDRVLEVVSAFVAEWNAAGVGEEVIVVLTGGSRPTSGADEDRDGDESGDELGTMSSGDIAGLLDRLMATSLTGENHHLVYTPGPLTPAQALDRGLRVAVSPVAVLTVGGSSPPVPSCFKTLLSALKRRPDIAVLGLTALEAGTGARAKARGSKEGGREGRDDDDRVADRVDEVNGKDERGIRRSEKAEEEEDSMASPATVEIADAETEAETGNKIETSPTSNTVAENADTSKSEHDGGDEGEGGDVRSAIERQRRQLHDETRGGGAATARRAGAGAGAGTVVTPNVPPDGGGPVAVRRAAVMGLGVFEGCSGNGGGGGGGSRVRAEEEEAVAAARRRAVVDGSGSIVGSGKVTLGRQPDPGANAEAGTSDWTADASSVPHSQSAAVAGAGMGGTAEWVRAVAAAGAAMGIMDEARGTERDTGSCATARQIGRRRSDDKALGATKNDGFAEVLWCPGRTRAAPLSAELEGPKRDSTKASQINKGGDEPEAGEGQVGGGGGSGAEGESRDRAETISLEDACATATRNLTVAYGVNFFKRPELFQHLPGALSNQPDLFEVLINDDSLDAASAWLSAIRTTAVILDSPKKALSKSLASNSTTSPGRGRLRHALMRSHDLHEVRGMNRLVAYSDADIVVLAQDDDLPPEASDGESSAGRSGSGGGGGGGGGRGGGSRAQRRWLAEIRALFCRHPRLALLGGKRGFKPHPSAARFMSKPLKSFGYGWWKKMRRLPTKPIQHHDPALGLPFTFVAAVNMGPLVVRRAAFLAVGMFHEATSCVGEPGIQFDAEIGLRLWEHGWQVGLYESGFRLGYEDGNDFGGEGTHGGVQWKIREANDKFNQRLMWDMYGGKRLQAIGSRVSKANRGLEARPSTNRY